MMTKKKTSRLLGIKFVWALPAIALLLFAFAEPNYQLKSNESENSIPATVFQKGEKEFTIHGKVVMQESGEPLPGASILIKGSTIGTVADIDGSFTLVDPNPKVDQATGGLSSRVVVSFVGLKTMENVISASGSAIDNGRFTFKMEDEVILIGPAAPAPPPPPPPPAPVKKEKLAPPPPPPPPANRDKEVFYVVEDMPQYPGGAAVLGGYVYEKQQKLAQAKGLKGKAKIAFTVNGKGKVTDIKIVEQDSEEVGNSAASIFKEMQDWSPGKQRGKAVPVKFLMPVEFK